jgi:hypothetical protein
VVADEVRNLATKSASAAKDTNELIADTMAKSEMGSNIVKDTSEYLNKIMNGVSENTWILKNIATATADQNESIEAIKDGFDQLSGVVHHNSATAEESAAATEEMSSQTDLLLELVKRFKVGESSGYRDLMNRDSYGDERAEEYDDPGAFAFSGPAEFPAAAAPVAGDEFDPDEPDKTKDTKGPDPEDVYRPVSSGIIAQSYAADDAVDPAETASPGPASPPEPIKRPQESDEFEPWKDDESKY